MADGSTHPRACARELERALRVGELELHYQPLYRLERGDEPSGVEALVRWRHPTRGLLLPGAFIATAEESGLIRRLGALVLIEACAQLARWGEAAARLELAVDVSACQLADPAFVEVVAAALEANCIAPERLCLELTESVLIDDRPETEAGVHALEALGVRIALDARRSR